MNTVVETIDVPSADGDAAAYLAHPAEGRHPAVLLLADAFGLRPQIRAMCQRIAAQGYAVLAPNLVYREHGLPLIPMMNLRNPDKAASALTLTYTWLRAVPADDTARDAEAWFDWLAEQPFAGGERVGVVGYCRGGFLALWVSARLGERVGAAAAFHPGGLDGMVGQVGGIRGEVLVRYADADPSATPEAQEAFAAALTDAGVAYSAETYPGAPHGFTMADTLRYDADAAARHDAELAAFFDRTLR